MYALGIDIVAGRPTVWSTTMRCEIGDPSWCSCTSGRWYLLNQYTAASWSLSGTYAYWIPELTFSIRSVTVSSSGDSDCPKWRMNVRSMPITVTTDWTFDINAAVSSSRVESIHITATTPSGIRPTSSSPDLTDDSSPIEDAQEGISANAVWLASTFANTVSLPHLTTLAALKNIRRLNSSSRKRRGRMIHDA